VSPGRDVVKVPPLTRLVADVEQQKPTPAMPERVIIFEGIVCAPEIGRTTAWIYVVLPKRLIGWHVCLPNLIRTGATAA